MMKKLLSAVLLSLALSASCLAAGASERFAAEEKAADAMVAAITGNTVAYEQVSKSFNSELGKTMTEANFTKLRNDIKKNIGTVRNPDFVLLNKQYSLKQGYNGIDELVYMGSAGKDRVARIAIIFALEKGAPKISGIVATPVDLAPQAPAPADKK